VEIYPSTFQEGSFFDQYPYFLPNAFTALVGFVALILAFLYLPETLSVHNHDGSDGEVTVATPATEKSTSDDIELTKLKSTSHSSHDIPTEEDHSENKSDVIESGCNVDSKVGSSAGVEVRKKSTTSFRELLQFPNVGHYVVGYFLISLVAVIYDEVIPLWCLSSIQRGGLEYTSREVSEYTNVTVLLFYHN
jgi:hypothetical protein